MPRPENTVATVCLLSRVWAEDVVTARQQRRAARSAPILCWTPALPRPVGEMDVSGHRQSLVLMRLLACHLLRVPRPHGPPLTFQNPSIPQDARTADRGDPGSYFCTPPTHTAERGAVAQRAPVQIYRHLWQSGSERGLRSHTGINSAPSPAIYLLCDLGQVT